MSASIPERLCFTDTYQRIYRQKDAGYGVCWKTRQEKGENEGEMGNVGKGRVTRGRGLLHHPPVPLNADCSGGGGLSQGPEEGPPPQSLQAEPVPLLSRAPPALAHRGTVLRRPRQTAGTPTVRGGGGRGSAMWRLDVPSLAARRPLATEEEVPVDPPGGEPATAGGYCLWVTSVPLDSTGTSTGMAGVVPSPKGEGGRGGSDGGKEGGWALSYRQAGPWGPVQWTWPPRVGLCDILSLCSLLTLLPQLHANTSLLCTDTALHHLPDRAPPTPLRNRGTEIARGHTGLEGSSTQGLWVRSPLCLGEGQTSPGSLPETVEPGKSVLPTQGPYGETEAGNGDGGLGLHLAAVHGRGSRALLNCGCVCHLSGSN